MQPTGWRMCTSEKLLCGCVVWMLMGHPAQAGSCASDYLLAHSRAGNVLRSPSMTVAVPAPLVLPGFDMIEAVPWFSVCITWARTPITSYHCSEKVLRQQILLLCRKEPCFTITPESSPPEGENSRSSKIQSPQYCRNVASLFTMYLRRNLLLF